MPDFFWKGGVMFSRDKDGKVDVVKITGFEKKDATKFRTVVSWLLILAAIVCVSYWATGVIK